MRLTDFVILCTVFYCELLSFVRSHSTLEEAQRIHHSPAKKYKKKLRKEDGAIRLVGGLNDFEGERLFLRFCLCNMQENSIRALRNI